MKRVSSLVCALFVVGFVISVFAFKDPQKANSRSTTDKHTNLNLHKKGIRGLRNLQLEDLIGTSFNQSKKAKKLNSTSKPEEEIGKSINKLFGLKGSKMQFLRIQKDKRGNSHIRYMQYYKNLPVIGSDIIIHVNQKNEIYAVSGKIAPQLNLSTYAKVAVKHAKKQAQKGCQTDYTTIEENPTLVIYDGKLAYEVMVRENAENPALWRCYVDAQDGTLLFRLNQIVHGGPGPDGTHEKLIGTRLSGEGGEEVSFQGWHDEEGNYFLYHKENLWGIFNEDTRDWEQRETHDWGTSDPSAISLANNFAIVQEWVSTVLGLNSFDDNGAFAVANVHVGENYVNAFWDGSQFFFGDGDGRIAGPLTVLDVAAHEYSHAITQYTSNLVYMYESGALNESYADITGAIVEFYAQPDGRSSYPSGIDGYSDWLCGEDCWLQGEALRDLRDPQRFQQPSYYLGTFWYDGPDDNGGVHTNSGVQNFAFYLLTEGGKGENDGHPYDIEGLGLEAAADIANYANMYILTSNAQYHDSREAWILAAATLDYDVSTVEQVWNAVGVLPLVKNLSVDPPVLAFGNVGSQSSETRTLQFTNTGAATTLVSGLRFDNKAFTAKIALPFEVPGGTTIDVDILFSPTELGEYKASLEITSNADDNPFITIQCTGTGTNPALMSVDPLSIEREVAVGDVVEVIMTVRNDGEADLAFIPRTREAKEEIHQSKPALIKASGIKKSDVSWTSDQPANPTLGPVEEYVNNDFSDLLKSLQGSVLYLTTTLPTGGKDLFVTGLESLENISSLKVLNGEFEVPNTAYLLQYDVIMVAANFPWSDPILLGNNLADYVDMGGRLCLMVAAIANTGGYGLQGRITDPEYMPITMSGPGMKSSANTFEPHPITEGIRSLRCALPIDAAKVFGDGLPLGYYDTGYLVGAYHQSKPIVAINVFPGDDYWEGDLIPMMGNTIDWLHSMKWLAIDRDGETIRLSTGEMQELTVTLDATDLFGGVYNGFVELSHNDPSQANPFQIPCALTVDGLRLISVAPLLLDFGPVWKGATSTMELTLTNSGTEATEIQSLTLNNTMFKHTMELPFTVPPQEQLTITVSFSPTELGDQKAELVITTNAEVEPVMTVNLQGTGTEPPVIDINPSVLTYTLNPKDMPADKTSTLSNLGGDVLSYSMFIKQTGSPVEKQKRKNEKSTRSIRAELIYSQKNYSFPFVPGRVIVGLKQGEEFIAQPGLLNTLGSLSVRDLTIARNPETKSLVRGARKILLIELEKTGRDQVLSAIGQLKQDPHVAYAEPDYRYQYVGIPNDESFELLYGMHNTGQTGGSPDADIDAPEAWDTHTGNKNVLVGINDSGIDYLHPDLKDNVWTNPNEIPGNGIDDDGNGYVDDIHGWDFGANDNDPMDFYGHGTHVSGTVAASGNNAIGVTGVMWSANVVMCKISTDFGGPDVAAAIEALYYAKAMGIKVTNNSWGAGPYSQALYDAIADSDLLFVAAAGNNGMDNDLFPFYPASYDLDNILSVAATDMHDKLAFFSNFGQETVDIGAPGVDIYSCRVGGDYMYSSGTSMASPHVVGAAGLIWTYNPFIGIVEMKDILMANVDQVTSLEGRVSSNGRLNVAQSLQLAGPSWVQAFPFGPGTFDPGEEQSLTVTVNPANLIAGEWQADILFPCNDPVNPEPAISVSAKIESCRSLQTEVLSQDFGTVWISRDTTIDILFANSCNDVVTIHELTGNTEAFFPVIGTPISVAPFSEVHIPIRFQPIASQSYEGSLVISSDAQDNPEIEVLLAGKGITPPSISVNPTGFTKSLYPYELDTSDLTLVNSGEGDFHFEVEITMLPEAPSEFIGNNPKPIQLSGDIDRKQLNTWYQNVMRKVQEPKLNCSARGFEKNVSKATIFIVQQGFIKQIDPKTGETIGDSIKVDEFTGGPEGLAFDGEFLYYTIHYSEVMVIDPGTGEVVRTIPNIVPDGIDGLGVSDNYLLLGNYTTSTMYVVDKQSGELVYSWFVPEYVGGISYGGMRQSVFITRFNGDFMLVEERALEDGKVINSFPVDSYIYGVGYSSGADVLIATCPDRYGVMLLDPDNGDILASFPSRLDVWSAAGDEAGPVLRWLQVVEEEGVVPGNSEFNLGVIFNPYKVPAGTHVGEIKISHIFPMPPEPISIPCQLEVKEFRNLSVTPKKIIFDTTWVGKEDHKEFTFTNNGSMPTTIWKCKTIGSHFSTNVSVPLVIPPYSEIVADAGFIPKGPGPKRGMILTLSDAQDRPIILTKLSGRALRPPKIKLKPRAFKICLDPNQTITKSLRIKNIGGADFHYSIKAKNVKKELTGSKFAQALEDAPLYVAQNGSIFTLDPENGTIIGDPVVVYPLAKSEGLAFDGEYLYYTHVVDSSIKVIDPEEGTIVREIEVQVDTVFGIDGLGVTEDHIIAARSWGSVCLILDKETGNTINTWPLPPVYYGGISYGGSRNTVFLVNMATNSIEERDFENGTILNSYKAPLDAGGIGYSETAGVLFVSNFSGEIWVLNPDDGSVITVFKSVVSFGFGGVASDESGMMEKWLSLDSKEGIVPARGKEYVEVTFSSVDLEDDLYQGEIIITHKKEGEPGPFTIPCELQIQRALSPLEEAFSFK